MGERAKEINLDRINYLADSGFRLQQCGRIPSVEMSVQFIQTIIFA